MRFDGALRPQQGASTKRSSIGATRYCNKQQCEFEGNNTTVAGNDVNLLGNCSSDSYTNTNNNNSHNNNKKNNNKNNNKYNNNYNNNKNKQMKDNEKSTNQKLIPDLNKDKILSSTSSASKEKPEASNWESTNRAAIGIPRQQPQSEGVVGQVDAFGPKQLAQFAKAVESGKGNCEPAKQANGTETKTKTEIKIENKIKNNLLLASNHVNQTTNNTKQHYQTSNKLKINKNITYNERGCPNYILSQHRSHNQIFVKKMSITRMRSTIAGVLSGLVRFAINYIISFGTCWPQLESNTIDMESSQRVRAMKALRSGLARSFGDQKLHNGPTATSKVMPFSNCKWTTLRVFVSWCFVGALVLLPCQVTCDENNFFGLNNLSIDPETTTPPFDYASRGEKKFGDKCENTLECGFPGSICDPKKKSCQCTEDLPVTNHFDKCGKEAAVNESCFFNEQCEIKYFQTECRDGRCVCRFEMTPFWDKDGSVECKGRGDKKGNETYIDPAMIGVLVGMALMFIIICVVLRLFSQARWRENRTIFNTPNPRLMNVSLLRESKLLHGQERRGSRMSVRGPSRQPSMASLRPHSPNPSLGKTGSRSNSHGSASNASATSLRSTRSNSVSPGVIANGHNEHKNGNANQMPHAHNQQQQQHHHQQQQQQHQATNITTNPVAESITVEIIEPEH